MYILCVRVTPDPNPTPLQAAAAAKRRGEERFEAPPISLSDAMVLKGLSGAVRAKLENSAFDRIDLAALFANA